MQLSHQEMEYKQFAQLMRVMCYTVGMLEGLQWYIKEPGQSFVGQSDNEEPMLMRVGKLKIVIPHYHDHYKYLKECIMQRAKRLSPDTSKRKYWEQKTINGDK